MSIRVMIVDDSFYMRMYLSNIFNHDKQRRFEVVASAFDGEDAIAKLNTTEIDIITLDVDMPKMNGLEVLEEILKIKPVPVIMLSSLTTENSETTMKALSLGAIDFIAKPESKDLYTIKEELINKSLIASKVEQKKIPSHKPGQVTKRTTSFTPSKNQLKNLVVIGCSTGGPNALQQLFSLFPAELPCAFVVAQHMPEGSFTSFLAQQIQELTGFKVKEAENGEEIKNGFVYIGPGGFQIRLIQVEDKTCRISIKKEEDEIYKPSVTNLFQSLCNLDKDISIFGVILTGMGKDGSRGAKYLKEKREACLIAQSEQTSVIYGMPRAVVELGIADYQEDLNTIPKLLTELILKR